MSYSNKNNLEEIKNKKILFYDLETTGLVKTQRWGKPEESYPDYKNLDEYNQARIVSIGYLYLEDFNYTKEINLNDINEVLIKPEDFIIPEKAIKIHKITNEYAHEKGYDLKESLIVLENIMFIMT